MKFGIINGRNVVFNNYTNTMTMNSLPFGFFDDMCYMTELAWGDFILYERV